MRLIIILSIFVISCAEKKSSSDNEYISIKAETAPVTLKKVRSVVLQGSETASIGAPLYRVEIDKSDRMYFFDTIESKFIVYEKDGTLVRSFAKSGRGPREFERVYAYTIDNVGNLIVYDDSQRLIKKFNRKFELIGTFSIDNNKYFISSKDMIVYNGNIILGIVKAEVIAAKWAPEVLVNSPLMAFIRLQRMDTVLYKGKYDPYLLNVKSRYNRPFLALDANESILYTSHQNSYRIQEYDLMNEQRLSYFGFKTESFGEGLLKPATKRGASKENYLRTLNESATRKVFFTKHYVGNFYLNGTEAWYDSKDLKDLNYYLAIYDRETKGYINTIEVEYRLIGVHNGEFYFIEDENPGNFTLGVYVLE
jgi:hypothetical protein